MTAEPTLQALQQARDFKAEISRIEDRVATGEWGAALTFTKMRELIDAALASPVPAAPAVPQPTDDAWLPIKTAPRDGTNVLLRFGADGVSQGKYVPGMPHPWKFIDTNDGITWLVNHAVDGPGGPSHWQPMPSAIRAPAVPASASVATDLHAAIMNLPCTFPPDFENDFERECYQVGHRDARHAAAELVSASVAAPVPLRMTSKEVDELYSKVGAAPAAEGAKQ